MGCNPTSKWCVRDWSVIKEPSSLHSVHPPALNANGHSALLTHNHTWWQDDPRHVQRLLFLWIVRETMEKSRGRLSSKIIQLQLITIISWCVIWLLLTISPSPRKTKAKEKDQHQGNTHQGHGRFRWFSQQWRFAWKWTMAGFKRGNFKLDEDVTNDYRFPWIEVWFSVTSVDCFALISYL